MPRTDAWTELIRAPQFNPRPKKRHKKLPERIKFQYVLASLGLFPPIVDSTRWFPKQQREEGFRLRGRISNNRTFAESAFGKTMGVAHGEWSPRARAAFGLEEPPTPYEVACFTLGQYRDGLPFSPGRRGARGTRRFFQGVSTRVPKLHTSAFMWWLIGVGDEAIEEIIPNWDVVRAEYIKKLMGMSSFALWALGCDLMPIVRSPRHARALLCEAKEFKGERRELFDSTYVQTLLKLGKRVRPIERRIPDLEPVFRTLGEKERRNQDLERRLRKEQQMVQGNMWWFVVGMRKYSDVEERKRRVPIEGWGYQAPGRRVL